MHSFSFFFLLFLFSFLPFHLFPFIFRIVFDSLLESPVAIIARLSLLLSSAIHSFIHFCRCCYYTKSNKTKNLSLLVSAFLPFSFYKKSATKPSKNNHNFSCANFVSLLPSFGANIGLFISMDWE